MFFKNNKELNMYKHINSNFDVLSIKLIALAFTVSKAIKNEYDIESFYLQYHHALNYLLNLRS